jgi:hypothetical protein
MQNPIQEGPTYSPVPFQRVEIDFYYLDLKTCARCVGTDRNLDAAMEEVSGILQTAGVEAVVRKSLVGSEAEALDLAFFSSPTIRVNGQDIALEFRESRCDDCEACAGNGEINCRVWVFRGREYSAAPKAMIVDAVLREIYGGTRQTVPARPAASGLPEDLKRFFSGKSGTHSGESASCCPPEEKLSCCGPSEKTVCCGSDPSARCGC